MQVNGHLVGGHRGGYWPFTLEVTAQLCLLYTACAVVFVVGVVVSLAYADRLIDVLTAMGRDYYEFVSIAPQEKLMQYFRAVSYTHLDVYKRQPPSSWASSSRSSWASP